MDRILIQMSACMNIGKREEQEDSVNASLPDYQYDKGVICAVADGVGGLANGKQASQAAVNAMVSAFDQAARTDAPGQILLRGLALAQETVRGLQRSPGECGSTLVAVLIRDGRCSFISVGDSRIYLYRGGSLILLTRDQNRARWIDTQISLGKLPEEARSDKKRNALTAYIGMESFTRADRCSQSFSLGPGDRLALMSDGVFGTLTEKEMTEVMELPEEQVANTMIKKTLAKRNPYQDNCTVAVVDCSLLEEERKVNDCSGIGRPYGME